MRYRCCDHCSRDREGNCVDASDGPDSHDLPCDYGRQGCEVGDSPASNDDVRDAPDGSVSSTTAPEGGD